MVTVCRGCTGRCRFRGIIRVCVVARTSLPPQQTVGSLRRWRCAPRRPGVRRVAARVPSGDRGANRGSPCAAVRVRPRRPVLGGGTYDRSNRLVYPQSRTTRDVRETRPRVAGAPLSALRSPVVFLCLPAPDLATCVRCRRLCLSISSLRTFTCTRNTYTRIGICPYPSSLGGGRGSTCCPIRPWAGQSADL